MDISELRWETRGGESFLTVSPDEALAWVNQDIEEACLQAGYLNVDAARIHTILREARSKAEYVGPWIQKLPPQRLEQVEITLEENKCFVQIRSDAFADPAITLKELDHCLRRKGIKAGIDLPLLSVIIRDRRTEKLQVAGRMEPQKGQASQILPKVKFTDANKPKLLDDGRVDFRSLDNIIHVKAGQLLSLKMPAKAGVHGYEMDGTPLMAEDGDDIPLLGGENTRVSDDGRELTALCDGFAYENQEGHISVGRLYVVDGDLNFKYGNIRYQGDVLVKGNVLPGFEIFATGSVVIEGEVDQARIIAGGDIKILGGFFGKDKGVIQSQGKIEVRMAQDATLEAKDEIRFDLQLNNCKIKAHNLISKNLGSVLRSCDITLYERMSVGQIGSEGSNPTQVQFHYAKDEELKARILEAQGLMNECADKSASILKRLQTMKAILKKAESISPKSAEELQRVLGEYQESLRMEDAYKRKIETFEKLREDRSGFHGKLEFGELFSPLNVNMLGEMMEIKENCIKTALVWRGNCIQVEKLSDFWRP